MYVCTPACGTHRNTQAQAISLTEELATAKQQAADARAAAHSAEKQLLAPSVAAAPLVAGTTTTPTAAATATASLAAAAAAGVGVAGLGAEESAASLAEAAVVAGGASIATPVGVGVGLKIEKGPSSEALRLEELKAELQATTAAKKKVCCKAIANVVQQRLKPSPMSAIALSPAKRCSSNRSHTILAYPWQLVQVCMCAWTNTRTLLAKTSQDSSFDHTHLETNTTALFVLGGRRMVCEIVFFTTAAYSFHGSGDRPASHPHPQVYSESSGHYRERGIRYES